MAESSWKPTAGLYCWAGPGTVRMIRLKFFDPPIDEPSVMGSYDETTLRQLKDTLNLSDVWVTYSWGFSDATEQEDYAFLRGKLPTFQKLGLRTHAYVQGLNAVTAEHAGDLYCRDGDGGTIPYHRGRLLTCPMNPRARELLARRVAAAAGEEVDGVFVDNFHFGRFPFAAGGRAPFFGCACIHCSTAYKAATGREIPRWHELQSDDSRAYRAWRADVMRDLCAELAAIAHARGKLYGCNGLDVDLETALFYGYRLGDLARAQDYLLTENFNHPSTGRSNRHLRPLVERAGVPVCTVSYTQPIGAHAALTQRDIDGLYSDSLLSGAVPIYKGSEFTTGGRWHNLDPSDLRPPQAIDTGTPAEARHTTLPFLGLAQAIAARIQTPLQRAVYENRLARSLGTWLIDGLTRRASRMQGTARPWLDGDDI